MSKPDQPQTPPARDETAHTPMTTGQPSVDSVAEPKAADPAPDIAALLKKAEDEALELKDSWLRSLAEIDNIRKQAAADVAKAYKYAIEKTLRAGVELTLKQLGGAFDKAQIKVIDPAGEKFDPHFHQAMAMVDSTSQAPNTVVTVFQKGYLLNDRVLRPALVTVAKAPE